MKIVFIAEAAHCSHRIPGWAEQLSNQGHDVTLITPKYSKPQAKFLGLSSKHIFTWIQDSNFRSSYKKFAFLNFQLNRVYHALNKKIKKIKKENQMDGYEKWAPSLRKIILQINLVSPINLMIVSVSPFSLISIGSDIARDFSIPWIIDYRDLWSSNHTKKIISELDLIEESKLISTSTALITVSEELEDQLKKIYTGKIKVIPNGFNKIENDYLKPFKNPIKILYTGSIYEKYQNIELVINSIGKINSETKKIELYIYGPNSHYLKKFLKKKFGFIPNWLFLRNEVSKEKSIELQKTSDVLLVLNWENPESYGILGTKVYEYFAVLKPILLTGGYSKNKLVSMITESGLGTWCQTQESLIEQLQLFISNTQKIEPNMQYIDLYSMKSLGSDLNRFLFELNFK